jgi:hypothetical protein
MNTIDPLATPKYIIEVLPHRRGSVGGNEGGSCLAARTGLCIFQRQLQDDACTLTYVLNYLPRS